ncbi:MAG: putative HTH-type transcriptional regulator [Candidatus Dichloromethanomonas elyunquensis]|nr:MAG: putative HTH-type transcriptional regulator [Candidatus Dichloromethanomonas elyunquensis]
MQFSVGVEYALHCLLYMVDIPAGKSVGIKDLALFQGVSETYLSKVYTKLRKAGIVKSIPGVNGGYELSRSPAEIMFQDVIEAVEGNTPLFQCVEIRQKKTILDKDNLPNSYTKCPCLIKVVMLEAEEQMKQYLRGKTLAWLSEQVKNTLPEEHTRSTIEWFNNPDLR